MLSKVNIYWHDFTGKLVFYKQLSYNQAFSVETYVSHIWSAKQTSGTTPLYLNGKKTLTVTGKLDA